MKAKVLFGALPDWIAVSGYGSGYGYGYGSGDGSGDGYGDGDGYGSGYGSGSGYGYGYGDGSGYGSGDGYGSGYGDGSGYGYWLHRFNEFLDLPRVKELWNNFDVSFGYWRSNENGKPSNGGYSVDAARPGLVQEIKGPLEICTSRALHATLDPARWKGKRLWLVALFGETQTKEDKMGALKREILAEVRI